MAKIDGKFWDERYAGNDSVYGKEPNQFFKSQLDKLKPGKIFLPGDGEGRNGVYAATKGWVVNSVDFSAVARDKAVSFAHDSGTQISYLVMDLAEYEPHTNYYDAVGMVFLHLNPEFRKSFFAKAVKSLKAGGALIFEAYSKEQLGKESGGPQNVEMLYDLAEIRDLFGELNEQLAIKETIVLSESEFHKGEASVIRYVGIKKD